ncbi:LysE family translocator [Falsiroseomonas tokyonensis]|uniref:LysE family translocator n=1 Tax=Falsiroseomonas tokyonensis TaxID=430521 RepID=A0ABV7BXX6_9PROT|nr:LysE family translocator [Falsiroseomonas tokyonensis]MBU8538771.1 LysE family translocator [Falsiroseomonas tokyonensis]
MPIDPQLFAGFLFAAWVLILTPGPDMLFVIGQSLAGGAPRGWAAMFGIVSGALVHVALAASGVAALIAASPALFEALRLVGAAYLIWLGAGALRAAWRGGGVLRPAAPVGAAFRQGFVTNLTNPKVILFFLAFLPQFVDPARGPAWLQMALLGPLVPLMSLPAYGLLIHGAGRAAARLNRHARWLEGVAGLLFLGLGLRLLVPSRG